MPLGDFEIEVLRVIAINRNPDSFLAGGTVLNQAADSPRISRDLDIFHDDIPQLEAAAIADVAALQNAGFTVDVTRSGQTLLRASVGRGQYTTKIEWANDSAFRFFPVEPDIELGWKLNFWDAATNKIIAAADRHVPRDYLDILHLHQRHLSLGALSWAASAKDPGLTPEYIIDWIGRQSHYRPEDFDQVKLSRPVDLQAAKAILLGALDEARRLHACLPPSEAGCLYLDATGRPVCPEPDASSFSTLIRHFGSLKGAWPRIAGR